MDGTPGYPAPDMARYVEATTVSRPKTSSSAFSGSAMPVVEQLALVTMKPPLAKLACRLTISM